MIYEYWLAGIKRDYRSEEAKTKRGIWIWKKPYII